ncbi:hypothetical protein IF1G_02284 [Cordyceps javanica]|uniref:Uncharacterized protein n=1 Tax=Cordyceps javanica TaxID=43265 RepID=A0A545V8Z8_9HYPO|nr:hypothetical protein IF1G_02284 [Cordyceps javanica]
MTLEHVGAARAVQRACVRFGRSPRPRPLQSHHSRHTEDVRCQNMNILGSYNLAYHEDAIEKKTMIRMKRARMARW